MPNAETSLENTEHLARNAKTLAAEKEIADLEAVMSGDALFVGTMKTQLDTMRDGTLVLAKLAIATLPVSETRAAAIEKLSQFFRMSKEAIAAKP